MTTDAGDAREASASDVPKRPSWSSGLSITRLAVLATLDQSSL
jgi:hypothetical protein